MIKEEEKMEELKNKLDIFYTTSIFDNTGKRNRLAQEIEDLEVELNVEHIHRNGVLQVYKILYKKIFY